MLRIVGFVATITFVAAITAALASEVQAQGKASGELVLVSGDDFKITVKDFRDHIANFAPLARHRHLGADTIRSILDDMINTAVFSAHAEATELEGAAEVDRQVKELAIRELLIRTKAKEKEVSDAEVKKYFDEHPERFLQGELRRASAILVKDKKKAESLRNKALKADSRAFAELVRTNSINPRTRMRGGDLRYFNRDGIPLQLLHLYAADPSQAPESSNIDPALVEAAFALETVGTLSPIVKVGENFALVRLTGKREPQFKTWQDAKEQIRVQLMQDRSRSSSEKLVDRLRNEQQVKVTPKPLESFVFKETATPK